MITRLLEGTIDNANDLISDLESLIEEYNNHPQLETARDEVEIALNRMLEVYHEGGGGIVRRIYPKW